ncbi:MFS transporter [Riemerella columbipharyngis]|uniref:MFS transporter, FHS family, L-fucose permease n=1 Tax=Riemerella columbipharyngis TaxID=1071918 RepID=A0A1G6Y5G3_9FLAO|nr:MFS transporter [Riemerella columbipharyngis]SDD85541.1 MFS transporter, FHS family, L-fucose permease [Riemerella columbipharyngis]
MNNATQQIQTKWSQFVSLIIVFFFWGFVASGNAILIPVFKKSFTLTQFQAQLVEWAFYLAYFIGSVIFFVISLFSDILQKFGYKKTLAIGLVFSALGAFLFVPAASFHSFWVFLTALFIVGLGFSVQQIVANPLAIKMGSPETGAHRLTMAGGINSLGTTLGPILLGLALFGRVSGEAGELNLNDVKMPFIILGVAFIVVAVFLMLSKIEDPAKEEELKSTDGDKFSIFKYPQLVLGMLAIFIYVGTEVTIVSNLPALLKTPEFGNVAEHYIAPFVSLYWGSLMIGRWNGSINVFNISDQQNMILKFTVPFVAFAIILGANYFSGNDISSLYIYPIWILAFIVMSLIGGKNAGKTLMLFGISGVVMMLCGLFFPDKMIAKYFFISGGLFCSIMWPSIFDLAIAGLGKNTGKGSSFLIMMILGGGVLPLIQGKICDLDLQHPDGIMGISFTHFSYIIPLLCFIYLGFYGFITPKLLKKQGVVLSHEDGTSTH